MATKNRKTRTCTLTVKVTYDPKITDPESLASALDTLMETALSTPAILDEYGNPQVGEFLVPGQPTSHWKCQGKGCDGEARLTFSKMAEIGSPLCTNEDCPNFDQEMELVDDSK